jgi:hypothetical protein
MKKITIPQIDRLNKEPMSHCKNTENPCIYPVCNCYDHDIVSENEANELLLKSIDTMLERLRVFIDDLKVILENGKRYHSREQLLVYRRRKIRLQKNFNYWKKRYDILMYNKK